MNTLTVAVFACVVVLASAAPSGLLGLGYAHHGHGHLPLVGASGVVSSNGAAGPAGVVTGHGAVGPDGIHNAVGHAGVLVGAHHGLAIGHDNGQWHGEGLLASQDWAGHGAAVIAPHSAAVIAPAVHGLGIGHGVAVGHGHGGVIVGAHDNGQWHGEGLLASQDWAGHGAAVIAPHSAAVISSAVHGLGIGHGVAVGHGLGISHGAIHHGLAHHGW